MTRLLRRALLLVTVTVTTAVAGQGGATGQEPKEVVIKFKVFDANKTKNPVPLKPAATANVFVRNPFNNKAQFLQSVKVTGPNDPKDGFYEMKISRGPSVEDVWLVEQLVIEIDDPQKDYNPAIITKVVSADSMTLYPGASDSKDKFSFSSYVAQLSAYRALCAELLEEEGLAAEDRRQRLEFLQRGFGKQLRQMEEVSRDPERLLTRKATEITVAQQSVREVLKLYELLPPEPPAPSVEVIQFVPIHRCRLFGRIRR